MDTFRHFTADPSNLPSVLAGRQFPYGVIGFHLTGPGLAPPDAATTVTLTLPPFEDAFATYLKYGSTDAIMENHWYDFLLDESGTGAEINGDVITLHYVDGGRGDDDLDGTNGVIVDPGTPAYDDDFDDDGVSNPVEAAVPSLPVVGDGNNDGEQDNMQAQVVSFPDWTDQQ